MVVLPDPEGAENIIALPFKINNDWFCVEYLALGCRLSAISYELTKIKQKSLIEG
jgi:hypothetical protein